MEHRILIVSPVRNEAAHIERAVESAVQAGDVTQDIGGSLGTAEAGAAIRKRLA